MRFAILMEEKEAPFSQTKGPKAWVLQPLMEHNLGPRGNAGLIRTIEFTQ